MKEELDLSTLLDVSSSGSSSKDKARRKRTIKKDSAAIQIQKQKKLAREAKRQLSQQEKLRLQKEKNRFHAQKSRDQHKEYVNNLERQVKMLKEELERSKHYCHSCKKSLNRCEQKPTEDEISMNLETINKEEIGWKQNCFDMSETLNEKGEPASFLRIFQEKEDHHLLKMVLFVVAIVAAVLFVNGPGSAFSDRGVMIPAIQTFSLIENFDGHLIEGGSSNDTLQNSQINHKIDEMNNKSNQRNQRRLFDQLVEGNIEIKNYQTKAQVNAEKQEKIDEIPTIIDQKPIIEEDR